MKEIWAAIAECPEYEVSDFGNIRKKGSVKYKKVYNEDGWIHVSIKDNQGKWKSKRISTLVWTTFVDPSIKRVWGIRFKDGNFENCSVKNLYIDGFTPKLKIMKDNEHTNREIRQLLVKIEANNFKLDLADVYKIVHFHLDTHGDIYSKGIDPEDQLIYMWRDLKKFTKDLEARNYT
jgi:hypothetical protein